MRVIAGEFKGRKLYMPKGVKIRPSAERVKEALFNILGQKISGAKFLELFAGSGNVGIEARSRGAKVVAFVDNHRLCIRAIEQNLKRLGVDKASVMLLPLEAEKAIEVLCRKGQKFDFVFLDPPYYQDKLKNCLIKICHYDILKAHSWVIAEHNKRKILPQQLPRLKLMFTKMYGDTALSLYQKRGKG